MLNYLTIFTFVIVILCLFSFSTSAGERGGGKPDNEARLTRMQEKLNLSEDQRKQMQEMKKQRSVEKHEKNDE